MALNTYSGLQASIANFLARSDLGTEIIDFIALAESEINRELRIRPMETTISFTIDAETEALPTGFLGVRSFFINGTKKQPLQFITPLNPNFVNNHLQYLVTWFSMAAAWLFMSVYLIARVVSKHRKAKN